MATIESSPRYRRGALRSPSSEYVPQDADGSLRAPQHMERTLDLSTGYVVGFVHLQVDVGGGSKILTGSVDRSRIRKDLDIFVHLFLCDRPGSLVQTSENALEIKPGIESDHVLRERSGLNQ